MVKESHMGGAKKKPKNILASAPKKAKPLTSQRKQKPKNQISPSFPYFKKKKTHE
jgi:hypothetical protein